MGLRHANVHSGEVKGREEGRKERARATAEKNNQGK